MPEAWLVKLCNDLNRFGYPIRHATIHEDSIHITYHMHHTCNRHITKQYIYRKTLAPQLHNMHITYNDALARPECMPQDVLNVKRRHLDECSVIEKEIILHAVMDRLSRIAVDLDNVLPDTITTDDVVNDMNRINGFTDYKDKDGLYKITMAYSLNEPYGAIAQRYTTILDNKFRRSLKPDKLAASLHDLIYDTKMDLTPSAIYMNYMWRGRLWANPASLKFIFEYVMPIVGTGKVVGDIYGGWGEYLYMCHMLNIPYTSLNKNTVKRLKQDRLCDELGIKLVNDQPDVVIYMYIGTWHSWASDIMDGMFQNYIGKCDILLFVHASDVRCISKYSKPSRIFRIRSGVNSGVNFIYLYKKGYA